MKSNNGVTLVLIAIILVFFVLFSNRAKLATEKDKEIKTLENTISNIQKQAKVTELKLNDSLEVKQAEIEALEITKKNLQDKYVSILNPTNIKAKDVDKLTTATIETHSIDTVTCEVDSFSGLRASYADRFTYISVNIDSSRKAIFDYTFRDSLTIVNYTKRHSLLFGLIKWKSYEGCRVISHNPKSIPTSVVSYSVIK